MTDQSSPETAEPEAGGTAGFASLRIRDFRFLFVGKLFGWRST